MKKFLRIIVFLLIGVGVVVWFKVSKEGVERPAFFSGYGEGELVYVSSPIAGQLRQLAVRRGDQVAKDAFIFELEREEEKAARAEAEETLRENRARLDKANLDYNRAKSLRDKRVIAPEEYDTAQQALLAAQHSAAARQRSLDQADWRFTQKQQAAPASGLVYDTYFRPGEWVPAGAPVLAVLPPEYMKVRFFVPEAEIGKLQVGAPLEIRMDGLAGPLAGKVSFVSPQAEYTLPIIFSRETRGKLVFLVEGSLRVEDAKLLHPGAPVEVRLRTDAENAHLAEQGQ
ncbi:MAG TPA: efflux RND transporter periplasmic adaptor subunit [Terrimicrobiaceae bacterium]